MFAVELKFESKAAGALDAKVDAINSLIGAFLRNGSLLDEFWVQRESDLWVVYGTAPARDAFHKSNWGRFVRRYIDSLAAMNLGRPRVKFLGVVPETAPPCECARSKGFILFTTFLHDEPPLRCLRCFGVVPLYRLPSASGEHSGLLSWESDYQACDTLQMNCRVGERFAIRQMSDPSSELSRSGLEICRGVEGLTRKPTYYYLHRAGGKNRSTEAARKCPSCRGNWLLRVPLHGKFDFKCDRCRLLSNIGWEVR